ncbi:MAG: FecR family protein [Hyphomonadaceae bacterium]
MADENTNKARDVDVDLEAAAWVDRRLDGPFDQLIEAEFTAWRAGDPRRASAYDRMAQAWSHPDLWAAAATEAARLAEPARRRPRRMIAAAAACLAFAGVLAWSQWPYETRFVTGPGEVRSIDLPDGSAITLSGRSVLAVRIDGAQRLLSLQEGEALISVAHEARPLIVRTAFGETQALGTRFNVDVHGDYVEVAVLQGLVELRGEGERLRLAAGRTARLTPRPEETQTSAAEAAAWLDGWIETGGMPLGVLVAELARYLDKPIRVRGPGLSNLEVAGRFSLAAPEETLQTLAVVHDLRVSDVDGELVLERGPVEPRE